MPKFRYQTVEVTVKTPDLPVILNRYGEEGWELVSATPVSSNRAVLIFKRIAA